MSAEEFLKLANDNAKRIPLNGGLQGYYLTQLRADEQFEFAEQCKGDESDRDDQELFKGLLARSITDEQGNRVFENCPDDLMKIPGALFMDLGARAAELSNPSTEEAAKN